MWHDFLIPMSGNAFTPGGVVAARLKSQRKLQTKTYILMKRLTPLLAVLLISSSVYGQTPAKTVTDGLTVATADVEYVSPEEAAKATPAWTHKGVAGLNLSQASFTNWAAGGDAAIAFDALFNFDLNYKKGKNLWTNRLELAYGINNTQSNGLRKTNDKIYFASNYGYAMVKNLYLGAMLTFNTQFDKGFDYANTPQPNRDTEYISKFMSPGYLTGGIGLIWTPKTWLKLTYAPASWRGTFVFDDSLPEGKRYGVEVGKTLYTQFGSDLVVEFNKEVWKNISIYSRLELYSNYLRKPQNLIVHWDTAINMKVTKWLSANLNFNMIYDELAIEKVQIKEVLGIGLLATF